MNRLFQFDKDTPLIFAHRGLVMKCQENTLSAVTAALEADYCDGSEFDVFLTKDNQVVLFHDENLKRVTGIDKRILDCTWNELKSIPIQKEIMVDGGLMTYPREEKIPLLKDVLQAVKDSGDKDFYMDIEMKPPLPRFSERRLGTEVAQIVRQLEMEKQVVSTGFDFFKLHALEKEHRAVYTGFAYDDDTFQNKKYLVLLNRLMEWNFVGRFIHSNAANVEFTLIDHDSIQKYHNRGMAVGTYTPFPLLPPGEEYRGPRDFMYYKNKVLRLASLGIDWIETDDPETVHNILYGKEVVS